MCQCCQISFYSFNIYICIKRYHGMCKYQQVNFFSNVVTYIRPTYGNNEELAPLKYAKWRKHTYDTRRHFSLLSIYFCQCNHMFINIHKIAINVILAFIATT